MALSAADEAAGTGSHRRVGRHYSRDMARVASLVVVACAVLVTACTAAHAPPVASGAGTSAQANGRSGQGGTPASPPPVRGAMYAGGGCSATPLLLGGRPLRIPRQSGMRLLSKDRRRGSCSVTP